MAHVSRSLIVRLAGPLRGVVAIPCGAIEAHLALTLAAVSVGRSSVAGIGERSDVLVTIAALRAVGCRIEETDDGVWQIDGVGLGGLCEPARTLDVGRAGLGIPLLIALVAMQPMTTIVSGDDASDDRAWHWLTGQLEQCGAGFLGRTGTMLPLTILGATNPLPTQFHALSVIARGALLLAALNCPGSSFVCHEFSEEDRGDALFAAFGAKLARDLTPAGVARTRVDGQPEMWPASLTLGSDSETALLVAGAALLWRDADVTLKHLRVDHRLAQGLERLRAMGAGISMTLVGATGDANAADMRIRSGPLSAAVVTPDGAAGSIDDYPLLAILAARASGRTVLKGWERRPEWLAPLARDLCRCGVDAQVEAMTLIVTGTGGGPLAGGCRLEEPLDHRVSAAFLILGLSTEAPVVLDHGAVVQDHYPSLVALLTRLAGSPDGDRAIGSSSP